MIYLANLQHRVRIPTGQVRRLSRQIAGQRNLSIAFVTDREIRKLNRKFLRHDYATDVLAFRLDSDLVGEVVVSSDAAAREARAREIPLKEEILRYVAHGILHLLGYDDRRARDRARMWARQERELARLLGRPRARRSGD